ncbi:hypothetical protein DACRYDRAFT_42507, partial [Dacryopinax primogenitus]
AWHMLAFREGHAPVPHIDSNDDGNQYSILFVLGNFTTAYLVLPQLGIQIPLCPGQLLFINTRHLAHHTTYFR